MTAAIVVAGFCSLPLTLAAIHRINARLHGWH